MKAKGRAVDAGPSSRVHLSRAGGCKRAMASGDGRYRSQGRSYEARCLFFSCFCLLSPALYFFISPGLLLLSLSCFLSISACWRDSENPPSRAQLLHSSHKQLHSQSQLLWSGPSCQRMKRWEGRGGQEHCCGKREAEMQRNAWCMCEIAVRSWWASQQALCHAAAWVGMGSCTRTVISFIFGASEIFVGVTWSNHHQLPWKGCLQRDLGKAVAERVAFLISRGFAQNINPALRLFYEAACLWKSWMTWLIFFSHLPEVSSRTNITVISAAILKHCFPKIPLKFYLIKEE